MTARVAGHPKTVVILGAGASAADGAPVQSDLFREYFRCGSIQGRVDQQMKDALQRYFDRLWGIHVDGGLAHTKFPTFEEALGILDIADGRNESFRGMGDDPHATGAQELRNHLTALIFLILEEMLRQPYQNHIRLVQRLQQTRRLRSTVFVSLNYDIIIDNAIQEASIQAGEHRIPDYAVTFVSPPHRGGTPFPSASLLLKLHGSLNWAFCPTCNSLSLFPHHKVAAELPGAPWRFRCQACQGLRVSIIIPPTFFKVMSNFYLQQVWKRAEEELMEAERIIFCGYSFPDADIHVKYLLKRAEINRDCEGPEVFVVNEHPKKRRSERKPECARYMRFFRDKGRVHWTRLSFEQFAENPSLIEDPSQWL